MKYTIIGTPLCDLLAAADDDGLRYLHFLRNPEDSPQRDGWMRADDDPLLTNARRQLDEYFAGQRREFTLPLAPAGTDFQRQVWRALLQIPYGKTASYAEQASRIGKPKAVRAVGLANGRNPLPVVIPCHRVIGADGSLTGYGGGLPIKKALLELEGALPQNALF